MPTILFGGMNHEKVDRFVSLSDPFALCCDLRGGRSARNDNMYDMGQEAGRLILKKLKNPKIQIQSFITLPELITRGTT